MRIIQIETTCALAERWSTEPFSGHFQNPRWPTETVEFRVGFQHSSWQIFEEDNHTIVTFRHCYFSEGDEEQFAAWGRDNGLLEIALHICELLNRLIDIVQTTFHETVENPFPQLRHFGLRDLFQLDSLYGARRQNLISIGRVGMDAKMARRAVGMVSKVTFPTENDMSKARTKLIRAVELLNSGYHGEALLVSFAFLDFSVQEVLKKLMREREISKPKEFLRAIPSNRLQTYLGSLLKMLTGHSLQEEEPGLWKQLEKCNTNRNNAMHASEDADYENARLCIETVRDILLYLGRIPGRESSEGSSETLISNLNLTGLPFLLDRQ